MKKALTVLLLAFALTVGAQEVKIIQLSDLQEKMLYTDANLTIFNFWATWCAPCIKELPYFDQLGSESDDIKVYLVSVDFPDQLEKVKKFVEKRSIKSDVLFLNEKDPDSYMPKVSPRWTGAIPATLFVTDLGKTYFHEKAFTKEELKNAVNTYMN